MLTYVSIALMLAGILATFFTSKKSRKVVIWSIVTAMVLQILSFLLFSEIVQRRVAFLWIGVGVGIGIMFGALIKLKRNENHIFYKPNMIFALSYLALLLINQIIALFFKVYVPIVLFSGAVALGMQIGFNLMLIFKVKKLRKISAIIIFICCSFSFFIFEFQAKAIDNKAFASKGIIAQNINKHSEQNEEGKILEDSLDGLWESELVVTKWGISKEALPQFSGGSLSEGFKIENGKIAQPPNSNSNKIMTIEGNRIIIESYLYNTSSTVLLTYSGEISDDMEHIEGNFLWQIKSSDETEYNTWLEAKWSAVKVQALGNNSIEKDNQVENNFSKKNPFIPQQISSEDANTAANVSGLLAGLAGLVGILSSLLNGEISGLNISSIPTDDLASQPVYSEEVTPAPATSEKTIKVDPPKPSIGTRRDDGKIFTKNHGWQNENYPEMNINSIKNTISSLEKDIQKHINKGDKLRTEIAKDELKRNKRELKAWQEDNNTIKRRQNAENEDMYQEKAKRWANHADDMQTAANVANTISFAADIALAVGSSGVSTALAAAPKTMAALSSAKEWAGTGAEIYDGFKKGKSIAQMASEQGAKKLIGKAVGLEFDKGKELYKINESTSKALKTLVAAGETSSGNIVGGIAEDMGIVENFGKGINNVLGGGESK